MERFGEKLHSLRKRHSLTIRELAEALGIKSSGYITALEQGEKLPSVPLLVRISEFFNVSTDKLLKDDLELDE
jgi:transcriptional regulator with XRE-family HTH domain